MNYRSIFKQFFFISIIIVFASCDNDANELGADIIGEDNFAFGTKSEYKVTASNLDLGPVASNNLPVNALGIYNNPVFGLTKAHFATQVELAVINPTIGANPAIESVVLTIPYFNTKIGLESDGTTGTYELDSIYGPPILNTKMNLQIYESGYYMRDIDLVTDEAQLFYTNQNTEFFNAKVGAPLNNGDISQNAEFKFSSAARYDYVTRTVDGVEVVVLEDVGPRMEVTLNNEVFQQKMFSIAAAGQLINNNVFTNYFRGVYFNVDQSGSDGGNLALINFAGGKITIKYKEDGPSDGDPNIRPPRVDKTLVLNLAGKSVSLLEQTNIPANYTSALQTANPITGDRKLYVKGGQGSMAVIDLFSELGDLEKLRADNLLINDASLTFTIDNDFAALGASGPVEPQRIYLYDLTNKRPILDYFTDLSTNSSNTKLAKSVHDGIIQKSSSGRGTKYRIRLTNHIRGLVNNADSTNVKLGLVVTESIGVTGTKKLKSQTGYIKDVPLMSVAHPFGTVLYGSNIPEGDPDYDKRLRLEIYYTKPN